MCCDTNKKLMRRDGARELGVMGGSFNMEDTRVSTIVSDTEPTLKNKREGEAWREENKTAEKKEKKMVSQDTVGEIFLCLL